MVLEDRAGPGPEAAAQSQRREQLDPPQRAAIPGLITTRALSDPQCGTEEGGNKGKEWKKRTEVGFSPPLSLALPVSWAALFLAGSPESSYWPRLTGSCACERSDLKRESQNVSRENVDEFFILLLLFLSQVIGCTQSKCTCECFQPGRVNLRSCDRCKHGWVAHAVSKLSAGAVPCSGQVEIVQCSVVFDISTLLLYGTQALPVRMKILLDRLFSVLTHTQVITILHTLGWTLRDYIRGYILQDSMGKVLDRWVVMTPEDEVVTLQQFLRFGETKSIVELMAVQQQQDRLATVSRTPKTDSDIRLFIESSSHHRGLQSDRARGETPPSLHHFENLPGGNLAFLLPFQYSSQSASSPLIPSSTLLQEASDVACRLQQTKQSHGTDSESVAPFRGSKLPITGASTTDEKMHLESETDHSVSGLAKPSNKVQHISDVDQQAVLVKEDTSGTCSSSSSTSSGMRDRGLGMTMRKGRVSCSACGKTFYDKGTLKIHYNAVHLKIKHRCTIEGCNMVFSSLRSRNRHSANPNPRLHTAALRNTNSPQNQQHPAQPCATVLPSRVKPPLDVSPLGVPALSSSILETTHAPLTFPSIKAVQPVLPFYSTVLSSRSSPASSSSVVAKTNNGTSMINQPLKQHTSLCDANNTPRQEGGAMVQLTANQNRVNSMNDTVPKKKSRKSSMPVKIKREMLNDQELYEYKDDDDKDDNDNDEQDTGEGSDMNMYLVNGLMTSQQSSRMPVQPPNGLNGNKCHTFISHSGHCSRRPSHEGDDHEIYFSKTCINKIQHINHDVLKMPRTSISCCNLSMKEGSEKHEGVMKKWMKREGSEGEDKWRERIQSGREERLLKVKEEVYDPSYDLHCSRHCDFNMWANKGVVAMTSTETFGLQKDFNTYSDQEEEDGEPDEEQERAAKC
ncbi:zinc finger protein basonuclin-2-like [Colossoma macropomum]|uniref:zinc finger protein basonuclin-2-like n=1 Tax=Colossoma macropomum TaxID=42526 RepID=UPI001863EA7D|nr:zinc finger protein basonuclin-2-like [Colossoma macropomum]